MKRTAEHFMNRINNLKYKDDASNKKKQVNNKRLIAKAERQLRNV